MSKARDLAEELYRSFKSQVLWKDVDFKRIDKFEKIIKRWAYKIFKTHFTKNVHSNFAIATETKNEIVSRCVRNDILPPI